MSILKSEPVHLLEGEDAKAFDCTCGAQPMVVPRRDLREEESWDQDSYETGTLYFFCCIARGARRYVLLWGTYGDELEQERLACTQRLAELRAQGIYH